MSQRTPISCESQMDEDDGYLSRQLVTCLGNKRKLLGPIDSAAQRVRQRVGKTKLRILDGFSGSGVVARSLKRHAEYLAVNDLEPFAQAVARSHLANHDARLSSEVALAAMDLNRRVDASRLPLGFIAELYAPKCDDQIELGERVFYSQENARRLDDYRRRLDALPLGVAQQLLGTLIASASVHVNTSGVFKGFHRDRRTKVGRFGGSHGDALQRILGKIEIEPPILSRHFCDVEVFGEDVNDVVQRVRGLDLAYFDPPYNQHPYGSNYFMLNLIAEYRRPTTVSKQSGIPADWRRSAYNVRSRSATAFRNLLATVDAKFILISFNNEGFISGDEMNAILGPLGTLEMMETPYNAFRGSRNLAGRSLHVVERLFLLERK